MSDRPTNVPQIGAPAARMVVLSESDTDRIAALEQRSFIPPLQADAETMRKRFALGHFMYGLEEGQILVGMIAAAYAYFDPLDRATFPSTEREFCMLPKVSRFNAVYMYNFEVAPDSRGHSYPRQLVRAAVAHAKRDGCRYCVACPRIPSYAGSQDYPQESVEHRPEVKLAIDRNLRGEGYPHLRELLQDPLLALYYRLGRTWHSRFHWIIPNFASYDPASGGIRVLLYGEM